MSVTPEVTQWWEAAVEDSGLPPGQTLLYAYDVAADDDRPTAIHVPPGVLIIGRDAAPLSDSKAQHAADNYGSHQILLLADGTIEVLAAKLRHELEHVRQWGSAPDGRALFQLYQGVGVALDLVIGTDPDLRRGSGVLYNAVPMEFEANAAASRFIRPRIDTALLSSLEAGEHAVLFRQYPDMGPVAESSLRMLCAAAVVGDRVEDAFEQGGHPNGRRGPIDVLTGNARDVWAELRADSELLKRGSAFGRSVPTHDDLEAEAPLFARAWTRARDAWFDAYDRAREVIGLSQAARPPGLPEVPPA